MSQGEALKSDDARRLLIERVASSRYVNRSARLRDLLLYVSTRVLDDDAAEIHEQEIGQRVFGRSANYDTGSDNIVRVHASMLRKRLEQYFASEGAHETLLLEIPKGNYAPVFRERQESDAEPTAPVSRPHSADWRIWALAILASLFACSTVYLLLHRATPAARAAANSAKPTVELFWSQILQPGRPTDIVLDDAAVGLYQEITGRPLKLSNYFDRAYLSTLAETAAAANLDLQTATSIVLRRQSNFAGANFLWKLFQIAGIGQQPTVLRFARDYSFRELKANNTILLGNSRSNPWVEPFEPKLGLRWVFDKPKGSYHPVDSWDGGKEYLPSAPGDQRGGYCTIALLPNLGHTGNVVIIAGTGGSAVSAGADFLADEASMAALVRKLAPARSGIFPYFEALIRVKGRSTSPRDAMIVVCRPPRV
jgi:hypothetical protein